MTDRRGVSEAVSFVLVFSLVISSVGTVYAFGLSDLAGARDAEQVNNVERAFELLADNLDELVSRSAPSRGTELRLQGGTLSTGERTSINVTGDYRLGSTNPEDFATGNVSMAPITYRAEGGATIAYENGAVVRSEDGGHLLVRDPNFVLDDDRVVVPIVQTRSVDRAVGGRTTVHIRTENALTDVVVSETTRYDRVTVDVASSRAPAWESYLSGRGMTCSTPAPETVSCTADDVDRIYVVIVTVDVSFE